MLLVKDTNTKSVFFGATLNVNVDYFGLFWIILQMGASGLLHIPLMFIPCAFLLISWLCTWITDVESNKCEGETQ